MPPGVSSTISDPAIESGAVALLLRRVYFDETSRILSASLLLDANLSPVPALKLRLAYDSSAVLFSDATSRLAQISVSSSQFADTPTGYDGVVDIDVPAISISERNSDPIKLLDLRFALPLDVATTSAIALTLSLAPDDLSGVQLNTDTQTPFTLVPAEIRASQQSVVIADIDSGKFHIERDGTGEMVSAFHRDSQGVERRLSTAFVDKLSQTETLPSDIRFEAVAGIQNRSGETTAQWLLGSDEADEIHAGQGRDLIFGGAGDDHLVATAADAVGAGADTLEGGLGNDQVTGADGADVAVYSGRARDYELRFSEGVLRVKDQRADLDENEGEDQLSSINVLQFADRKEFVVQTAHREALRGDEQGEIRISTSKLVNGTQAAETFVVDEGISAMILAGIGDKVVLQGTSSEYQFSATGNQFHIEKDGYLVVISMGGAVELVTEDAVYALSIEIENGVPTITQTEQPDASQSEPNYLSLFRTEIPEVNPLATLYQGVGVVEMTGKSQTLFQSSTNLNLALQTPKGALAGLSYDQGMRVALVSDGADLWTALEASPQATGNAQFMHNLFSWAATADDRLPGDRPIRVFDISGVIKPAPEQNIFVEAINDSTSYDPYGDYTTAASLSTLDTARYSEALLPQGNWAVDYDVIVADSNISADALTLLNQWAANTGGGIILRTDGSDISSAVSQYISDLGFSYDANRLKLTARLEPQTALLDVQTDLSALLFGTKAAANAADPLLAVEKIKLVTSLQGYKVDWTSDAPDVISATGEIVGAGQANLTARITAEDGTEHSLTRTFEVPSAPLVSGLNRWVFSVADLGVSDLDTALGAGALMSAALHTDRVPNLDIPVKNALNGADIGDTKISDTLWLYQGYLLPSDSGRYTLKFAGHMSAYVFETADGVTHQFTPNYWETDSDTLNTLSVDLIAGEAYKISLVTYESRIQALQWKTPSAPDQFDTVPVDLFRAIDTELLTGINAVPLHLLPKPLNPKPVGLLDLAQEPMPYWIDSSDSRFDMQEYNLQRDLGSSALSDELAAQVKTVSWSLYVDGRTIDFINLPVPSASTLIELAANIQSAMNIELERRGLDPSLSVTYVDSEQRLLLQDRTGREIEQFILARENAVLSPEVLAGEMQTLATAEGTTGVAIRIDSSDIKTAMRIQLSLDSAKDADDLLIVDLPRKNMGMGSTGPDLANRFNAAIGQIDTNIQAVWNEANSTLEVTDLAGRVFTHLSLTSAPVYEPLLQLAGDFGVDAQGATYAALGTYAGSLSFDESAWVKGVVFNVEEAPRYGSVTVDISGHWRYVPSVDSTAPGFDQFTVRAYLDGVPVSDPMGVQIAQSRAPAVSQAMVTHYEVDDPVYVAPAITNNAVPNDLLFEDIFVAQTHVQRLDDPYLTLVDGRYIWVKLNVSSESRAAAPDFTMKVFDEQGNLVGSRLLVGPAALPAAADLDLPSATNIGVHTNSDSYTAPIPKDWVSPGMSVEIIAGSGDTALTTLTPTIQSGTDVVVQNLNFTLGDIAYQTYGGGLGSWAEEAMAKLPVSSYTQIEYSSVAVDHLYRKIGDQWAYFSNITDGMPGSDSVLNGWGGYEGGIGWALDMSGAVMRANGGVITATNSTVTPGLGGGLGGGSKGGGSATPGIIWHEFAGHGSGLPHAGTDASYPYNGLAIEGVSNEKTSGGEVGYNWAFDPLTGNYLPNFYVGNDGETYLARDPMQGGTGKPDGYQFDAFSDYYEARIQNHFEDKLQWNADPSQSDVDGGFAGEGYFYVWDAALQRDVVLTADNYSQYTDLSEDDLAHQRMVDVYTLLFDIVDVHGNAASPGVDYYPDLEIFPIETQGNLSAPLYDILDGSGREPSSGDYVLRVTYATESGVEVDHLLWPSTLRLTRGGFNVPNKGELVAAEFVEASNGSVDAYLDNKVVASYVNPDSLINTVFADQSQLKLETGVLNLPVYWSGNKIVWAASHPTAVDLGSGAIDLTQVPLDETLVMRATWVDDDGRRFDRSFCVEPPATYEIQQQLFGYASANLAATDGLFVDKDIALPSQVAGAAVVWTVGDTAILSESGEVLNSGSVSLAATLTWPDGRSQTYSQTLNVSDQRALAQQVDAGLSLAIFDTSAFDDSLATSNGSVTDEVLRQYLNQTVLSATPVWTGVANPTVTLKTAGYSAADPGLPNELLSTTTPGRVIDSLWIYGGYLVAPTTGTYTLNFTADQYARLMIGDDGLFKSVEAKVNQKSGNAIQIELHEGEPVPIWIAYKSQEEGGYWGDYMTLEWAVDGAPLAEIPVDNFLPIDPNLFLTNGALNLQVSPFVETRDVTSLAVKPDAIGLASLQQLNDLPEDIDARNGRVSIIFDQRDLSPVRGEKVDVILPVGPLTDLDFDTGADDTGSLWLKLQVLDETGEIVEIDSRESWSGDIFVNGGYAFAHLRGDVDMDLPGPLVGLRLYLDQVLTDAAPEAVVEYRFADHPLVIGNDQNSVDLSIDLSQAVAEDSLMLVIDNTEVVLGQPSDAQIAAGEWVIDNLGLAQYDDQSDNLVGVQVVNTHADNSQETLEYQAHVWA